MLFSLFSGLNRWSSPNHSTRCWSFLPLLFLIYVWSVHSAASALDSLYHPLKHSEAFTFTHCMMLKLGFSRSTRVTSAELRKLSKSSIFILGRGYEYKRGQSHIRRKSCVSTFVCGMLSKCSHYRTDYSLFFLSTTIFSIMLSYSKHSLATTKAIWLKNCGAYPQGLQSRLCSDWQESEIRAPSQKSSSPSGTKNPGYTFLLFCSWLAKSIGQTHRACVCVCLHACVCGHLGLSVIA